MVDKTPHEAMAGSASGLANAEIMLLLRTSPPTVNSIRDENFFGPNEDQAARGNHGHVIADSVRPGFMSTGDRAKLDALSTSRQIPAGGTAGYILQKISGTDYDITWAPAPAGGGGGGGWVQQNTQSALQASNPTMALGAIGWETDTGRWKIGDGVTAWNSLAYTDMAKTPATITNPGTTTSFRFRTNATQIVTFTAAPAGTVTIQAPTSGPPASHEGEMYLRLINNSGSTITISAAAFQLDGDYLVSSIPTGTAQEYTLWVLGGTWYISGGQDLEEGSVGNAQLADIASGRIKGRYTAGTGDVEDLVPNQVRWLIDNAQPNTVSVAANTTLTKAAHQGRYLLCSAAVNLTVDNSTDFDQHYAATIRAEGGAVTVVATATVHAPSGLIIPQHATGVLRRETATDVYSLEIMSHPKVAAANSVSATTASGTTTLALTGDAATPGNSKYYGTNSGGTRGYYDLPTGGGGATNLDGLTDVVIASPVTDQVVKYNGTNWVNSTVTIPGGAGTVVANMAALQAIGSPTDGDLVHIRGYATDADGGEGTFQWDSAYTDYKMVTGGTVAAGGTGYAVGQLVWVNTGTPLDDYTWAYFRVVSVSGGVVTGVTLERGGRYTVAPTASASAMADGNAATGLTLNLTIASWSDGGTIIPKAAGGAGRWMRRYDGYLNVLWFGAVGDGVTDCADAIQKAVNTGNHVFFPRGTYKILKAITWFYQQSLSMSGVGIYSWNTSRITDGRGAGVEEPMFHHFTRYMGQDGLFVYDIGFEMSGGNLGGIGEYVHVRNLWFTSNQSIYGACFEATRCNNGDFVNCCFESKFRGLTLGQSQFDTRITNCQFKSSFKESFLWTGTTGGESNKVIAQRAWGLYASGHKTIMNNAFVGCGTGIYMIGIENIVIGARMETNLYAIIVADTDYYLGGPSTSICSRSFVGGISMEANAYGLLVQNMTNMVIEGLGIQGSPADGNRPESEFGIYVESQYSDCRISEFSVGGTMRYYGVVNYSAYPLHRYISSTARPLGSVNSPFILKSGNRPVAHLLATPLESGRATYFNDFCQQGITQLDLRGTMNRARNLGGTVTVAQGATNANVAFQTQVGISTIAFNGFSAVADGASTLPAGTYYYATTVIGWNAEVGVNLGNANAQNHRTITVTAGQRVDMTFYGGSSSQYVRRIYRSYKDTPGIFEGYWQIAMGANFSDTNNVAFTGSGLPPANGDIPSTAEADTSYRILATADGWNSGAIWITAKTTTGFTVNCETAAPAGGGIINWMMYRA